MEEKVPELTINELIKTGRELSDKNALLEIRISEARELMKEALEELNGDATGVTNRADIIHRINAYLRLSY